MTYKNHKHTHIYIWVLQKIHDTKITTTAYASKFHRDWAKAAGYHADVDQGDGMSATKFYAADTVSELNDIDTGGTDGITIQNKHNNRHYRVRGIEIRANSGFVSNFGEKTLDHTLTYGTRWHYDSYYDQSFYNYYNNLSHLSSAIIFYINREY